MSTIRAPSRPLGGIVGEFVERERLTRFCADLGPLRALLRGPAGAATRAQVEQVVRAARRGEPVAELIAARDRSSSADDDEAPRVTLPPRLSDLAFPPVTGGYVCPVDACDRVDSRRPGAPAPHCDVHQQALRFRSDGEPIR
jgi:hypothetical protein